MGYDAIMSANFMPLVPADAPEEPSQAFAPDRHGFFNDLVTMLVSLSSYLFSMHVLIASNNPTPLERRPLQEWVNYIAPVKAPDFPLTLERNADGKVVVFYPAWLLMHLSLDTWPQFIEYRVVARHQTSPQARLTAEGNRQIIARIVGASFTNYYANQELTFKSHYGNEQDRWPETIRFAWLIRNGFAHGSSLYIRDQALRPVTWAMWSFGHQHNGQEFLLRPGMLGIGDIVALMQEFDALVRA